MAGELQLEQGRLSEAKTTAAFAARDWPALKVHLDDVGIDDTTLDELLGHLQRASGLILRYPDAKRETRQGDFFENLSNYIRTCKGEQGADKVAAVIALLAMIQRGYRSILATLNSADISKLPPPSRVAACLEWSIRTYHEIMKAKDEAVQKLDQMRFPNGPFLVDQDGASLSVDAAINGIVCSLSTTLVMEAHKNAWKDSHDTVVLPDLPSVDEAAVSKAGVNAALAMCWSRWQRTEERRRFFGGEMVESSIGDLPKWAPADATTATEYMPDEAEFLDYAANERLMDRLGQEFVHMMVETNVKTKVSGISKPVAMSPAGIVSLEEVHAVAALGNVLKYKITDDMERPGGLRLVEWLRGYAVLIELASDASLARPGSDGLILTLERADLLSVLERCGLIAQSAALFIDAVTLKVTSKDLFDSPLIRTHDGKLIVYGPALLTSNLMVVLLSTLAGLQESLPRKGRALEDSIVSLLCAQNLHARGFEVTRNGEQYEYDVVLAWGDYVFVFECKNHNLSNNRAVNAYYFDLGIRSAVGQVKRLTDALREFPDILMEQMQIDVSTKTVVPCVLNSLPYARTGELDGVYCTDSSIFDRFFSDRYFFLKMPIPIREKLTVLHRVALASQWKSEKPSPEDLLDQLRAPVQLKILKGHTELKWGFFPLAPAHVVGSVEFVRIAWTMESMAKVFGLSPAAIQKTLDQVEGQVKKLKKAGGTRKQKKQRRPRKGK